MKPKGKSVFVCQSCGAESPRWMGRCPECDTWGSMVEEVVSPPSVHRPRRDEEPTSLQHVEAREEDRLSTGSRELDLVLGGGLVPGSLVLVGGDPGIGKSTLLLQASSYLSQEGQRILYVSGEESARQTKLRATRLGMEGKEVYLYAETDLGAVLDQAEKMAPAVVIIDSIQAVFSPELSSAPGTVSQVRTCTGKLLELAKGSGVTTLVVGHVTKDGSLAGPRVLEHMVDTVLYFEGERHQSYRVLRAIKNRFGSTNEVGVFEMTHSGLKEVENPSDLFLALRAPDVPGSCVVVSMEGSRPILLELQALVTPSFYGVPQRVATGLSRTRLAMLLAVLEKRAGISLGNRDVFANVAGGMKLEEPGADLGLALAVASSRKDVACDSQMAAAGEVGLAGEVRPVAQLARRIAEAARMGFKRCLVSPHGAEHIKKDSGLELVPVRSVRQALEAGLRK
jgi:DNA repair protein RadA/Sms